MKPTISDILLAPWKTGALFAAIRLKVFSILSDQRLTAEEVASGCGAVPDYLRPLLDACVSMGLMHLEGDKYMNSHFSRVYFVEGQRCYVGDFLNLLNDESPQWFELPDIIRGKRKVDDDNSYIRSDYDTFIRAMNSLGELGEANTLKESVNLSGCKEMVDAGGGSGLYSITFCRRYPELHSTILDARETLSVTEKIIAGCKEKERLTLREGDLVEDSFGENIDVVLLSDVVYAETSARLILRNAWNCLVPDGLLIVRGYYADPEGGRPLFGALFAVKGLVDDAGRKMMTISVLENAVRDIGFTLTRVSPLTEHSYVLIGRKQEASS